MLNAIGPVVAAQATCTDCSAVATATIGVLSGPAAHVCSTFPVCATHAAYYSGKIDFVVVDDAATV